MSNSIKELRIAMNIKQAELADYLNVSQGVLSNWERGVGLPDARTTAKLAQRLKSTPERVLGIKTPAPSHDAEAKSELLLHQRIAEVREARGLKPADLAALLDMDEASVARLENGVLVPDLDLLRKIAYALNISTDYLLGSSSDARHTGTKYDPPASSLSPDDALRLGLKGIVKRKVTDADIDYVKAIFLAMEKRTLNG